MEGKGWRERATKQLIAAGKEEGNYLAKKCESVIFLLNKSKDLDSVILLDYDYWEN